MSVIVGLLVLALVVAAVGAVAWVAGANRVRSSTRRGQELVPGRESAAPMAWAGAHTPEAKLHRRLVDAVDGLRTAVASVPGASGNVDAIATEAVRLEERLVAIAAISATDRKTQALAGVEAEVDQIEQAAADLALHVTDTSPEAAAERVDDLRRRLDVLAEARAEVEEIDRRHRGEPGAAPGS